VTLSGLDWLGECADGPVFDLAANGTIKSGGSMVDKDIRRRNSLNAILFYYLLFQLKMNNAFKQKPVREICSPCFGSSRYSGSGIFNTIVIPSRIFVQ